MLFILLIVCGVTVATNNTNLELIFGYDCNPLVQCDEHYSVATFAKVNWLEAHYICNSVGAVLATVNNPDQHLLMLQRVNRSNYVLGDKRFWLGATNLVEGDTSWTWLSSGLPMTYSLWAKNEPPSDENASDACLMLGLDTMWHAAPCNQKFNFICENICLVNDTTINNQIYV
ncbi:macrophage mannose receptor 1 [Drosophila miranda]|uniref:macrophage mannose receptor 1 n=1 Tax=Drosophila miranda TaxID=7229 RepID=UPI0007E814C2|nr:macrophage mannose receptor 1 [Drosophila miranda]